jgi:pyruvate formate lyase activating enzyme
MTDTSRRNFLKRCSLAALGACAVLAGVDESPLQAAGDHPVGLHEADYYTKLGDNRVQCTLCPCSPVCPTDGTLLTQPKLTEACNHGMLLDGQTCVCRVRTNRGGKMYVTNYGRASALGLHDPVEKNPLYHFHPGTEALTVSGPGCSLACKCCQNWQLSQFGTEEVETVDAPPEKVVRYAEQFNCKALAYTYTEPMMFFEYMSDIAKLARPRGIWNTVVSGGYVNPAPVKELCGVIDAFSISVKAFSDADYISFARGKLSTIQKTMETVKTCGRWLEVVVLVIPTVSDNLDEMKKFVRWVKANLGADTPIHFDRFWPSYKVKNLPQTPIAILEAARAMAVAEGIRYPYIGNLPGHAGANTVCPKCSKTVIRRVAFHVIENNVQAGACKYCGYKLAGVW